MWHSFYRLTDGVLTGARVNIIPFNQEKLDACTPDGCAALTGELDSKAVRVDLATGDLVAYQPPSPGDTAWHTWTWDAQAWCWVSAPTEATLSADLRAERSQRLAACDWVVARATELGEPVPTQWAEYRAALRDMPAQPGFPHTVDWPLPPAA